MSTIESPGYAIACDWPDCGLTTGDLGDYAFWGDVGDALTEWQDAEGYSGDEGDFCSTHTTFDDDDDLVPLPFTVDSLLWLAGRAMRRRIDARFADVERQHRWRVDDWRRRDESAARRDVARARAATAVA